MRVGVARPHEWPGRRVEKARRADDPEPDSHDDEEKREKSAEVTGCVRLGGCAPGWKRDLVAQPVESGCRNKREHGERDEGVQHRGDRRQTEEVEADVAPENRILLTDIHAVERLEEGHPEGGSGDSSEECQYQRGRHEKPGEHPGDVDRDAVAPVHVEHREGNFPAARDLYVAVEISERKCPTDEEERHAPDQRGNEDRPEPDLIEPEPVSGKAGEPWQKDESNEGQRKDREDDPPPQRCWHGRQSRSGGTIKWVRHVDTTCHHGRVTATEDAGKSLPH